MKSVIGQSNHVLIVEDDVATAELELRALRRAGCEAMVVRTLDEAVAYLGALSPIAIILDFNLGSTPAWPILETGRAMSPPIPVIMVTAMGDERVASEAIQRGASDYVIKTGDYVRRLTQSVDNIVRVSKAERALQQMKEWQSAILSSVESHIALLDESGEIVLVNDAWKQFADENGMENPTYGVGLNYDSVCNGLHGMDKSDMARASRGLRDVLENRVLRFRLEYRCSCSAEDRWFRLEISPVRNALREGAVVMHVDITDRVLSESARLANATLLNNILQGVDEGILVVDADGKLLKWNRAAEDILGTDVGVIGDDWLVWLRPQPGETGIRSSTEEFPLVEALAGKIVGEQELSINHPEGRTVFLSVNARPLMDATGAVCGAVATFRDITEKLARDVEIRRIAAAMAQTADGVTITDTAGQIEYVNPAFEKIYGYMAEEVHGKNTSLLVSTDADQANDDALWAVLKSGQAWSGRLTRRTKSGTNCIVESTITPVRDSLGDTCFYVATERDVTAQVAMELHLRQAQKMEAIGVLAGGIAHDFNNILAAIDGYARMAESHLEDGTQAKEDLSYVIQGAHRAKDLVRQILTFSRQRDVTLKEVDLNGILQESVELMRATLPSSISIRTSIDIDRAEVLADETQLQQIIVNLCNNAAHAMKQSDGVIDIRLSPVKVTQEKALALMAPLVSGNYALLEVEDNGTGIPEDLRARIFDPFFSTKKSDGGTGLGLATVLGIVKEHRGTITVESTVGKGTTFFVYLPLCVSATAPKKQSPKAPLTRGNGEHILVVDDEKPIAALSGRMLQNLGYRVSVFNVSSEALETFRGAPASFDLVLTDLTMPGMKGNELAAHMRALRPDLPIILLSGYVEGEVLEEANVFRALAKPVQLNELANTIREALDLASGGASE